MLVAAIIGGILLAVLLIVAAFYFLGQKFILQLTNLNADQRKGHKEEVESGVKDIVGNHEKWLAEIRRGLEKQLSDSRKEVLDLSKQNAAIREQLENTA